MDVREATVRYEKWMATHVRIVNPDLVYKHEQMSESPFAFMRATFYRWLQLWEDLCKAEAEAPSLLAVGDLHIENFGTWRDAEGRLIWGVNDFDEAFPFPYTLDLVRLATSAHLAIGASHLSVRRREACDAILEGYAEGIKSGGEPFVLDERHRFLRSIALGELRDPLHFWARMRENPDFRGKLFADAKEALELLLPDKNVAYLIKRRRAGLGSLGRQRFVALADWRGGMVAREIKSVLPSAAVFAGHPAPTDGPYYLKIASRAIRVPDPFVRLHGNWVVRRLAPDCSRIDLASLPQKRDETRLLYAMGFETANIHLGSDQHIKQVRANLAKRKPRWLHDASKKMAGAVEADQSFWRRSIR
jgi:Uncharacterized protein conserved in bacteria (DUF2252)